MATVREKVIQSAERLVARGKVEAAIREYRKVLADNPRDTNTLNRVGDLYARIERIDEAVGLFVRIAEHYTEDGFFVKAIAIYKKIIKLDPTRLEIYERLAELYHKQGLVNEARTQYQVLVDYYQKHGEGDAAIGICQRMVTLEPSNPSHRARLADLLQEAERLEEAMAEYRAIAEQLIASGQADGAVRVYEKALDVHAGDLGFLTDAVLKLRQSGQAGAAARLLASAVRRNPQAEQVARLVGQGEAPAAASPSAPAPPGAPVRPSTPAPPRPAAAPKAEAPPRRPAPPAPPPVEPGPPMAADIELVIEDEAPVAEPAAAPAPPSAADAAEESVEFDLEMDDVFVFDLEDDGAPSSQVAPPPDMVGAPPRRPAELSVAPVEPVAPPPAASQAATAEDDEMVLDLDAMQALEASRVVEPEPAEVPADEVLADEALIDGEALAASEMPGLDAFDRESEVAALFDAEDELDLDADLLERTASELEPEKIAQQEDLVTEAEVLAKYGLIDKAHERLGEVFRINPRNLGAYALQIGLYLEAGRHERVVILANEMAAIAAEAQHLEPWERVRQRLLEAGYRLEGKGRVIAGPASLEVIEAAEASAELALSELPAAEELDLEPVAESEPEAAEAPAPFTLDLGDELGAEIDAAVLPAATGEDIELVLSPGAAALEEPELVLPTEEDLELSFLTDEGADEALSPAAEAVAEPGEPVLPAVEEVLGEAASPPAAKRKRTPALDLDATLAQLSREARSGHATLLRPQPRPPARPAAPPAKPEKAAGPPPAPPTPRTMRGGKLDLGDELRAEIEGELAAPAPPGPPASQEGELADVEIYDAPVPPPAAPAPGADLDDSMVSWLDEVVADPKAAQADARMMKREDDFFDLAAELEAELQEEEALRGDSLFAQPHEQSLEEIVEGFKRGVAEHLSAEDYETHYNLGLAYREMGLIDEAIGEFQLAAKSQEHLVDCCSMLGLCFLDKGLPELAIKWYRRGLDSPGLSEQESLGLLYDLGSAYVSMGEQEQAYRTFVEIYGINTNYRDVVARLEELAP